MGAPVIIIERLFSGRESISALQAAATIAFNRDQVEEREAGDGIREADNIRDLMKAQVPIVNSVDKKCECTLRIHNNLKLRFCGCGIIESKASRRIKIELKACTIRTERS